MIVLRFFQTIQCKRHSATTIMADVPLQPHFNLDNVINIQNLVMDGLRSEMFLRDREITKLTQSMVMFHEPRFDGSPNSVQIVNTDKVSFISHDCPFVYEEPNDLSCLFNLLKK